MKEEWRDIPGYEGLYQVSNLGNVKSLRKNIILKPHSDKVGKGYLCVNLGRGNHKKIHRLVAEVFIFNPNNKKEVNHKDGNTQNNNINNLEWVSHKENCIHYTNELEQHTGQYKMRAVCIKDKNNENKMSFKSISSAIRWIQNNTKYKKAHEGNIGKVINNKEKTMYGYNWEDIYE